MPGECIFDGRVGFGKKLGHDQFAESKKGEFVKAAHGQNGCVLPAIGRGLSRQDQSGIAGPGNLPLTPGR